MYETPSVITATVTAQIPEGPGSGRYLSGSGGKNSLMLFSGDIKVDAVKIGIV